MDFRILGPLEASHEGRGVTVAGSKQRALLALLLIHANETLSVNRLIDELWGEHAPARAAKAVQVHVSRLRKALASAGDEELLLTRERGYELRLDPRRLDSCEFERLVEGGRNALAEKRAGPAVAALEEALALWRGAPLCDLGGEPFARLEAGRLEELRAGALEQLVEAKLALGCHAEVVGQLEALIAEYPYRERPRAQLMLALYRCDRQADALQTYQEARRRLVDELGIEPGERLRELERAVLAQEPSLLAPLASRSGAPAMGVVRRSDPGSFVGREHELSVLMAALDRALAGSGGIALIAGEPGIGKSRLADELMSEASARGATAVVGRCWEAGGAPAYWPWVQSLRAYVRQIDTDALREQLGGAGADLARLLPELHELLPGLPRPLALESDGERFRLFEAVRIFLRSAVRIRPLVLVLDDLHAADEPSLLLLRYLGRDIAASRLFVVCAFRDVDPRMREPLASTIADLAREPHTIHLGLEGLSEGEVARYVDLSSADEPAPPVICAIHAETGGNPLFVVELVRLLESDGLLADAGAARGIPPGVRAVIGRRVGRLSRRCRDVLILAAVLGRDFPFDALARISALDDDELLITLDEAMAERLVCDAPQAQGRLRFAHALIRDTLYDGLTPARRMQLHARVGSALEELHAGDVDTHAAEIAHHFVRAAPGRDRARAIDYARRAAAGAARLFAFEEASRLFAMALDALRLERPTDDETRCALLLALGEAEARAGDAEAARRGFLTAADLARSLDRADLLARAALGYGGRLIWVRADDELVVPLLEEAIAALGSDHDELRVRVIARLCGAGRGRPVRVPRDALSREALATARRVDDPATLAYALEGRYAALYDSPFTAIDERLAVADEMTRIALEIGDRERSVHGRFGRFIALVENGDATAAKSELAALVALATESRQPAQRWMAAASRAAVALFEGSLADAEDLIARALALGERAQRGEAVLTARIQLALLRLHQGRIRDADAHIRSAMDDYPSRRVCHALTVHVHHVAGRDGPARTELAQAARELREEGVDSDWVVSLQLLAGVAASVGDRGVCERLYRLLEPHAARVAVNLPEVNLGSASRGLGLLAAALELWDAAERHFDAALAVNAQMGARPWLAHVREDYARMLGRRRSERDASRAREHALSALEGYQSLGMTSHAGRVEALVRGTGNRRSVAR